MQTVCAGPVSKPSPCCRCRSAGARPVQQRLRCQRDGHAGFCLNSLPAGATGVSGRWPGGGCHELVWPAGHHQSMSLVGRVQSSAHLRFVSYFEASHSSQTAPGNPLFSLQHYRHCQLQHCWACCHGGSSAALSVVPLIHTGSAAGHQQNKGKLRSTSSAAY